MHPKANSLILLLGGTGSRFGGKIPKQFLHFSCQAAQDERPLFSCTTHRLLSAGMFHAVVFVVHPHYLQNEIFLQALANLKKEFPHVQQFVAEGKQNRHQSFRSGWLTLLRESFFDPAEIRLAVHDANRPHLSQDFLERIKTKLQTLSFETPCFVPAIEAVDSMLQTDTYGNVFAYIPREFVRRVQTPQLLYGKSLVQKINLENSAEENLPNKQNSEHKKNEKSYKVFKVSPLDSAGEAQRSNKDLADFSDEGSMMLYFGFRVLQFQGDPNNKKITFAEDV